jgi:truncated hemoglobin YjbI
MLMSVCVHAGADFTYRSNFNNLLEVEWMGGDSEMTEEEYAEERYRRDQLHQEMGGRHFRAWLGGAGYVRREGQNY